MVEAAAAHFRDAYFGMKLARYDLEIGMRDFGEFWIEEVHIYSGRADRCFAVAPLESRRSKVQINMKAKGSDGSNLVVLPRSLNEALHTELFEDALPLVSGPGVPPILRAFAAAPDWKEEIMKVDFNVALTEREKTHVTDYFRQVIRAFPENLTEPQAAFVMMAEFLLGRMHGHYRPWVTLETSAVAPEQQREHKFTQTAFVKYVTDEREELTRKEKLIAGILGNYDVEDTVQLPSNVSSHFRLRPPDGLVFDKLAIAAHEHIINASENAEDQFQRDQVQLYLSPKRSRMVLEETNQPPRIVYYARVSQVPSTRIVVAIILGMLWMLPVLFALLRMPSLWDGVSLAEVVGWLPSKWLVRVIQEIDAKDVTDAAVLSVPLVFSLVASAWNYPAVRRFAVTQLLVSVLLAGAWLIASPYSTGSSIAFVAGVIGLFGGLPLVIYNGVVGAQGLKGMSSEGLGAGVR